MEITYLGHSCFKIKTKSGTLVTDPYSNSIGLSMPSVSADIVTVSHQHDDHNNASTVSGTARRKSPFVISEPGEYEIEGISVFGYQSKHDDKDGAERGENTIYVIQAEDMRLVHMGDLGHELSESMLKDLDGVDVLMIPVGGVYTIDAKKAAELTSKIEPSYVLPMHYRTDKHDEKTFGAMTSEKEFVTAYEHASRTVDSLKISKLGLSEDSSEVILFE